MTTPTCACSHHHRALTAAAVRAWYESAPLVLAVRSA